MLNDIEYIRQGIESVLIYTRSLTGIAMTLQLSFVPKNGDLIDEARRYRYLYRDLFRRAARIANRNVIREVLEGGVVVTEFTLPMELLTEELFNIDTDKETTRLIYNFESGIPVPTPELINEVTAILTEIRELNKSFRQFITDVIARLNDVTLFMYGFEVYLNSSYDKIDVYNNSLDRILNREKFSPGYVAQLQYSLNEIMVQEAYLVGSYINQSEQNLIKTSRIISKDFQKLLPDYFLSLSPELQANLSKRSYELVLNFISYLKEILNRIKNRKLQFIANPLFFDNILTEVNFYKFILEGNIKQITDDMNNINVTNSYDFG